MQRGTKITDIPPEVFTLIVDHLLLPTTTDDDGGYNDTLDFTCLRLSNRGVRQLCDAVVRRLDLHLCSSTKTEHLLQRFTGATTVLSLLCLVQPLACLHAEVDVLGCLGLSQRPTLV